MRFVDSEPLVYVRVVTRNNELGILEEVVDNAAIRPRSILIEQRKWCIPMEQGNCSMQTVFMHRGDHVVVVLDGVFVDRTMTEGEEAWP